MNDETEVLAERRGSTAFLTINRPRVHNAMNGNVVRRLKNRVDEAARDPGVRVVVICGAGGKAFTSGADISEIAGADTNRIREYNRDWLDLFRAIELCPKPVIAAVQGWATGGGTEMSLACDFVVCSDTARFGLAEINIGVIPGAGAAIRLTRWVGRLKAKEILMLGRFIGGEEAVAMNLANLCVPQEGLAQAVDKLAGELATKAPLALAAAKSCVNTGADPAFEAGLEYELREFILLFSSEDQKEGMRAFLEKRPPVYRGR